MGSFASASSETRRAQAVDLAKKLVAQDAVHSIHADLRLTRDPKTDHRAQDEARKRTEQNCIDFAKLRHLIDVGRPLSDYSPIEKLGVFRGQIPHRFFFFGLGGFVFEQGPEPYLTVVGLDSNDIITKVGPLVAAE